MTRVVGELYFAGSSMLHLDRGTFMWVSIKRFCIESDGADEALLMALVGHPEYGDHYAGGAPIDQDQHDLHGPYLLSTIGATNFEPVTFAAAEHALRAWAETLGPQGADTLERLREEVYSLLRADVLVRLANRALSQHDWGWVVGDLGFHEFVAIDRHTATLTLIVASDD